MEQYSELLTSREYAEFLRENAEYAQFCGYNVSTSRGMTEAMADQFLFEQFMAEVTA